MPPYDAIELRTYPANTEARTGGVHCTVKIGMGSSLHLLYPPVELWFFKKSIKHASLILVSTRVLNLPANRSHRRSWKDLGVSGVCVF